MMRKSFVILSGIFVCALSAMGEASQQKTAASESLSSIRSTRLSSVDVTMRIAQARQLLQAESAVSRDSVRLAALDLDTGQVTIIPLSKDEFLTKDAELDSTTDLGQQVRVRVIRANGVNTAVAISDTARGESLVPLVVQFPIVRNGGISEVAYYTSAHPALLSPELTSTGQGYVRTMLDQAAARLAANGVQIPIDIVNVAEHLCVVEHTDHKRFMNEDQSALFPEILSLYALNQGNTFRYSVSIAGAGGMIQMIPRTYEAIRQQHPNVSLNSDFISGMRDHDNALQAMLLYMNDTWNGLAKSSEVQDALTNGIATKAELIAAGYNSNPARLPGYLKNGAEWRSLIPAETQIYLTIYASVDKNLHFEGTQMADSKSPSRGFALSVEAAHTLPIFWWLRESLMSMSAF